MWQGKRTVFTELTCVYYLNTRDDLASRLISILYNSLLLHSYSSTPLLAHKQAAFVDRAVRCVRERGVLEQARDLLSVNSLQPPTPHRGSMLSLVLVFCAPLTHDIPAPRAVPIMICEQSLGSKMWKQM